MIDQRSKPRLIITLSDGMFEKVYADNIPGLVGVDVVILDADVMDDEQDDVFEIGGIPRALAVVDVSEPAEDFARDVGRAYANWAGV